MNHNNSLCSLFAACLLSVNTPALSNNDPLAKNTKLEYPLPAQEQIFYPRNPKQEKLGRLLFFDKIISGNKNIACATCHHPFLATGDGLSLPVGEGGEGLGMTRDTGSKDSKIHERVARNSPPLFNLGAKEFEKMFYDGRVQVDFLHPQGFISPAGEELPGEILTTPLAAQALFPVTSTSEMAGQAGENPIADAAAINQLAGTNGVWHLLALRLQAIPEYVDLFIDAFDDINQKQDITFAHAGEAIGAFEAISGRCDNSRFDQFLRGDIRVLSKQEREGMYYFYSEEYADCALCHSGTFQTDQDFHAIGMPQIGPGKGDNLPGYQDGLNDLGRYRVTGDEADLFKFRTPTLRMVAQTGPWGHNGAYNDLELVIRHHLDSRTALNRYDQSQAVLPARADLDTLDFSLMSNPARRETLAAASELEPRQLTDRQVKAIVAFLHTLTDTSCLDLRRLIPQSVPSGLPLGD